MSALKRGWMFLANRGNKNFGVGSGQGITTLTAIQITTLSGVPLYTLS